MITERGGLIMGRGELIMKRGGPGNGARRLDNQLHDQD
jgi:hypothetical protein